MNSVWAVARNTIAQALRMKSALAVVVLLLILLPSMSFVMEGDGTLLGKLQTFVSYGLSLTGFLLSVLTIVVSSYTLSEDIRRKQIYLVVTKPVFRFQVLLGKLLGVVLLDVLLLGVFGVIIYGLTVLIPKITKPPQEQVLRSGKEFFTARRGVSADLGAGQVEELARVEFEKLQKAGQIPEGMTVVRAMEELCGQVRLRAKAVGIGEKKVLDFRGIRVSKPDNVVFVRYKYEVSAEPADGKVRGLWLVGDTRQLQHGGAMRNTPVYEVALNETTRSFHEFAVPADAVADDGYISVVFYNNRELNNTTVILDGLEVLYEAGTFVGNYTRCVLLIFARLVFLGVLGVSLSTWLSFPVAVLVGVTVFFVGTVNGFITESFSVFGGGVANYYDILRIFIWLLPKFDGQYSPSQFIVPGKLLDGYFLARVYAITVLIKATILIIAGMWIFSKREIAKISV